MTTLPQLTFRDYLFALLLWVASTTTLGLAQRSMGVMRDEGMYFHAAERYWGWFAELSDNIKANQWRKSFSVEAIDRYWKTNNEHPVLMKVLFALSWRMLHRCQCTGEQRSHHALTYSSPHTDSAKIFSEISAFRFATWVVTGFAVALIYIFGVRVEGRIAGLTAALLYITIPHVIFHGQLACFDSAVITFWLWVVYAYVRSLEQARWGLATGIVFGLALAVKHNAWFIPPLLAIHYLVVVWDDISLKPLQLPRIPFAFIAMIVLGALVFYAHWPWLWYDTVDHLNSYFSFHLHHDYYNMEYLGKNYNQPPFPISYPFGMTLFTVPTVMLLLMGFGLWAYLKFPLMTTLSRLARVKPPRYESPFRYPARRSWLRPGKGLDPKIGTLLSMNAFFPLALIAWPTTPIFGGTKHFMSAYPFIALLAGVGLSRIVNALQPDRQYADTGFFRRVGARVLMVLPLCVAVPGALNTIQTHPFQLSQYNALAGGPAGGADLGLNRQFWGYSTRQILPWMNETLSKQANVYFHDTIYSAYGAYLRDGLLRPDIRYSGMERPAIEQSDAAITIHELHFNKYDYWIWESYGSPIPTKVLTLDGVPLISAYRRPLPQPPTSMP